MIILLIALATSHLVAHTESAAMFPFTFRIPLANHTRDLSSIIMLPAVGQVSPDTQILRSIFDGFSFWATSQAVKLDPLGDSLSTSVTSSVISPGPVPVADNPAQAPAQAAAEPAVADAVHKESSAAEPEPVVADEIQEPAAVEVEAAVADDVKEPLVTVVTETQVAKSDATASTDEAVTVEAPSSDPAEAPSSDPVEAPSSDPAEAPSSDPVETPSTVVPIADEAEPTIELAAQASELEVVAELDSVTEHSMDAIVISAPESVNSDVSEVEESSDVISLDASLYQRQSTAITPYSETASYLQDMSYNGYDMYSRPAATPFECGNIHCSGDPQCTHFNWIPSGSGGTCYLKCRPSSGWQWAQPAPTPSYCGHIPKRCCPAALISICIYIDAIINLPFISALIG